MKSFLLSFFICCTFTAFSQTKSLKVYSNFVYLNSERYVIPSVFQESSALDFEQFSLAYRTEKEKSFWEYEAGLVLFQKSNSNNTLTLDHIDMHLRIERGFKVKTSENNKFRFYISPALKAYYLVEKTNPQTSTTFPKTHWIAGINGALFFRGQYHFSEKWYLDFNTSFIGGNLGVDFQKVENPALTINQQTQGGFDFDILGERILRIGLGYHLN